MISNHAGSSVLVNSCGISVPVLQKLALPGVYKVHLANKLAVENKIV